MTEGMDGSFVQNFKQRKSKYSLTLRQKEVLQLLAEGRSMKEVAFVLKPLSTHRCIPQIHDDGAPAHKE